MPDKPKGIKGAAQQLTAAIGDLSSLEVQVITGDLVTSGDTDESSVLDWKEVIAKAKDTNVNVKLVMATKIEFDGDTTMFVQSLDQLPKHIVEAHDAALAAGKEVRQHIMDFAKDLITDIIK